jgi:hypothetical protein
MSSTTMAAVASAAGTQYGGAPYQQTGYLQYDWSAAYSAGGSLQDLANWVQAVYRKPQNRVQSVTVDAAAHPAAWPFWAGASVGDMVQVNIRLPTATTSPLISLTARITQTDRKSQFSVDGTSATIQCALDFAPEASALVCDDAVHGKLDGSQTLPWLARLGGDLVTTSQITLPNPRTWSSGDLVTVPRLRADAVNAAALMLNKPFFVGQCTTGPAPNGAVVAIDTELTDNWGGHQQDVSADFAGLQADYWSPLPGWYLCDARMVWNYSPDGVELHQQHPGEPDRRVDRPVQRRHLRARVRGGHRQRVN